MSSEVPSSPGHSVVLFLQHLLRVRSHSAVHKLVPPSKAAAASSVQRLYTHVLKTESTWAGVPLNIYTPGKHTALMSTALMSTHRLCSLQSPLLALHPQQHPGTGSRAGS